MPNAKPATPKSSADFSFEVRKTLVEGLRGAGITAEVDIRPIPGTKLHRVAVLAKAFEKLNPSERQDLVWRIMQRRFTAEQQLWISMILTLTPADLDFEQEHRRRKSRGRSLLSRLEPEAEHV